TQPGRSVRSPVERGAAQQPPALPAGKGRMGGLDAARAVRLPARRAAHLQGRHVAVQSLARIIHRFSEDLDLTYDIRHLLSDLVRDSELPNSRSQKDKWTKAARERLPEWIEAETIPVIRKALARDKLEASLTIGGNEGDSLLLEYPALHTGPAYVQPVVKMEFGGRATGEPH